ncbi:MAG TPA: hypothetical protein VGL11_22265 [Candidatus Binatia bacterium]
MFHSVGLLLLFDPLSGLYNSQPILEQDWGLHFHHLTSMVAFWKNGRTLWGYNPFFMAGYPSNTIQDLSIKLFELLSLPSAVFGLEPIRAFKLIVYIAAAVLPWMMYFTARNFFIGEVIAPLASVLAALLGTAYWWNSLPREMFFYGVIGFPPAVYLSLFAASLLYRAIHSEGAITKLHLAWILTLSAMPPLHFQSVAIFVPPALALLAMNLTSLRWRTFGWLIAGVAVALVVNLPWILPLLSHRGDDVSASIVAELPLFTSFDTATIVKDYLSSTGYWTFRSSAWEKGLRWLLLIFGAIGLHRLIKSDKRDVGVALATGAVVLVVFSYFGSLVPFLSNWQPLRFKIAYDFIFVLAAAHFIAAYRSSPRSTAKLFPFLFRTALICGVLAFSINLLQTEAQRSMRLRTQTPPEIDAVVAWIRNEAPPNGRLLFEESGDETGFFYKGVYLSSLIPHWTGRQLIGGPINLYNDRHHFAEFHSAILFKRGITTFMDEELRGYFRNYNIGAVIAFHPRSVQRLLAVPGLVSTDRRIGDLHLMKVDQPLSWFLKGEGELAAGFNRLRASKIRGEEIVLKYHWTPGLVSDPPASITQEKILDDPIPFIKIIHPPEAFTLSVRGATD